MLSRSARLEPSGFHSGFWEACLAKDLGRPLAFPANLRLREGLAVIHRGNSTIGLPYWHADGTMDRAGRHQEAIPHRRHVRTQWCLT